MADRFDVLVEQGRQAYAAGRPAEAITALDAALALATTSMQLRAIADGHRRFGRMDRASDIFRRMIALNPDAVEAHVQLAMLNGHKRADEEVAALLRLEPNAAPVERVVLQFALGKVFDDLDDVARAFFWFDRANRSRRAQLSYATADTARQFDAIAATLTPELIARLVGGGVRGDAPIFIVGMPRSGSTLTEQILASHPEVFGGGEMNLLGRVEKTMVQQAGSLGGFLAAARPSSLADWAMAYLTPIRQAMPGHRRFTDKNLINFQRVGLIRLLFPDAKIVHCVRDPLDTCFSIYRRYFTGEGVAYGYHQSELGAYFRLYADLMVHWDMVLPGFVYTHRYEELVADPEPTMRRLLAFCDLGWDPRCLDFFKTERGVTTSSAAQVRRPVYADSVGVADRYRPHLGPLIAALAGPAS